MGAMTRSRQETSHLQVGGVRAEITYKHIKSLRMRVVPPDGAVRVSVPFGVPQHTVEEFIRSHHGWLDKARRKVIAAHPPQQDLTDGAQVPLWGTLLDVEVSPAARPDARVEDGRLIVAGGTEELRRQGVEQLYRRELMGVLPEMLAYWEPRVGRRHEVLKLRKMTSRWGSCNTRTASITLNTALAKYPRSALEYVVVHELMHLIERGHGPRFRAGMDKLMPDWQQRREALRGSP